MPYIVTTETCGLVDSQLKATSWREACALGAMRCEDRLAELESLLARKGDTPTLQHARHEIRRTHEFLTGSNRGYRLPKPILPGSRSVTDANPWRLTIERR